jgi:hypothetical protein
MPDELIGKALSYIFFTFVYLVDISVDISENSLVNILFILALVVGVKERPNS